MARKRQLDPDFFKDEDMADVSYEGRLFFAGTWCYCEDTGIFEVKHRTLKAHIFPYDTLDTKPLYEQLRDMGKYVEYTVNGMEGYVYAFIKGFHKRQTIQYPSKSHFPLPPDPYLSMIPAKIRKLNDSLLSSHCVLTESSHRVEKNRVELSRVEVELSGQEIANLKNLFKTKEKIKTHLSGRGFTETKIKDIIGKHFYNLK